MFEQNWKVRIKTTISEVKVRGRVLFIATVFLKMIKNKNMSNTHIKER
jgi:uncharacterized membrane protein